MKAQSKQESSLQLDSICEDYSGYNAKIASIALQNSTYSLASEAFLFIMEYLQLISQALLLSPTLYENFDTTETRIPEGVIYCAKILNPGFWLLFEDYKVLTLLILACLILSTLLRYTLAIFISRNVYRGIKSPNWSLYLWRMMYRLQGRVTYYFVTSVWVQLIWKTRQGQFKVLEIDQSIVIAVGSIMLVLEYVLSFGLQIRFCYVLPTKNLLCSKDNNLEIITLTQKLFIQILQIALPVDNSGTIWAFTIINLLFSLLREGLFFTNLPFYHFKALQYQERLLATVLSLNIACFIQNTLVSLDYNSDIRFIIVTWIILTILIGKVSREYLNQINLNFNSKNTGESCKYALHRIRTVKYLRSLKTHPSDYVERYEPSYIMNNSISVNIDNLLNLPAQYKTDNGLNIYSKQNANKIFVQYLETLSLRFPRDEYLKLYIAYLYAKKLKLYGIGMKIVMELQKSSSYRISLSASLLIYDIQKSVQKDYKDNLLNLHSYIKNQGQNAKLKRKLLELIRIQRDLYSDALKESPDLEKLFQLSQKIYKCKQDLEAQMSLFLNVVPDHHVRPLMIYSLYHLTLSHSVVDYLNYHHKYNLKFARYSKLFKDDKLLQENLYQDTNILLIISGQKPDTGKILYSSRNIEKAYGGEIGLYLGTSISTLVPPCLRKFYEQSHQEAIDFGRTSNFSVPTRNFLYHKEGYLVETDLYLNIHPQMTRGLFLDVILRPVPTTKDCIMLNEQGNIEGMTRNVAKRLGLAHQDPQDVNIRDISQELWEINEAFNLIHMNPDLNLDPINTKKSISPQSGNSHTLTDIKVIEAKLKKAQEIYSKYTLTGNKIEITSIADKDSAIQHHKIFTYGCQVVNKVYGSQLLKFIHLEEISRENKNANSPKRLKQLIGKLDISEDFQESIEKEIKSEASDDLQLADEKQGGWINLKSAQSDLDLVITKPFETIEEPLNFPLSPTESHMATPKALIKKNVTRKSLKKMLESSKPHYERLEMHREYNMKPIEANNSIGSVRSKTSQEKRISHAFKVATAVKYMPNSIRIITLIYYTLLISLFATQLSIKTTIDGAVSNIRVGKDLIRSAEDRNYFLANIMFITRLTSDLALGKINGTDLGNAQISAQFFASYIQEFSASLSSINKQLMINASLVNTENTFFFDNNVKAFNSDTSQSESNFTELNNFQAVDLIVETCFRVANAIEADAFSEVEGQVSFLLRNTVNDIYLWNDNLSEAAQIYVESERQSINKKVKIYIISTALLGAITNILVTIFIIRLYFQEKSYMRAIATLNNKGIKKALDQINDFERILELEAIIEDQENTSSNDILKSQYEISTLTKFKNNRKSHLKAPDSTGLRRKYIFRIVRIWITGCIIVGLTVGNCLLGTISLQSFQSKQSKLDFASRLGSQATLVGVASQELLAGNGTTLINDELSSEIIGELVSSLIIMKNQAPSVFMNSDFTYDSLIEQVLFYNGCGVLDPGIWSTSCQALQAAGKNTGLIYLLGDLETLAKDKADKFAISDRSAESLLSIELQDFQTLVGDYFIVAEQCTTISDFINQEFENKFVSSAKQRTAVFTIYTLLLVWMGIVVWIMILRKLMNLTSDIKVVLQAFPATLVLSSFILKTFLMKTSRGALDIVKNNI